MCVCVCVCVCVWGVGLGGAPRKSTLLFRAICGRWGAVSLGRPSRRKRGDETKENSRNKEPPGRQDRGD